MSGINITNFVNTAYYVATTGDNGNTGGIGDPFQTITYGLSQMSAGDVLLVRGGTYDEYLNTFPSGTSWGNPVTVQSYPGETVIILPTGSPDRCMDFVAGDEYIIVDGFDCDGTNVTYNVVKITGGANHIRLKNCKIHDCDTSGLLISGTGSDYNEIIDCEIYNNGTTNLHHGIYVQTVGNLIDGCILHDNVYGHGVQAFSHPTDLTIKNSIAYGNDVGFGLFGNNTGNRAYNCIAHSNSWAGFRIGYAEAAHTIQNCTSYNNEYGVLVDESTGSVIKNVICSNNTSGLGTGIRINSDATNTTIENCLSCDNTTNYTNNGTGTSTANNLFGDEYDADFVNPGAANFDLQSTSDAIDAGQTISDITDDIAGTARPYNSVYDIGAYEYDG